ncbi:MAG: hypothetical protein Tsb0021_12970 [Chlamydiales bacterium]
MTPLALFSVIREIQTIHEIEKYFDSEGGSVLGVFDIDETLLIPSDAAFQKHNIKKYAEFIQHLKHPFPIHQQDLISNVLLLSCGSKLIEDTSPFFIEILQKKRIPLIALTAAMTRSFGPYSLPEMRQQELKLHGIDFSSSFPELSKKIEFVHLQKCQDSVPVYYQGVLCSNGDHRRHETATPKGKVLIEFLKIINHHPNKIVAVDDKLYNLEEMERSIQAYNSEIKFYGFHYKGAQNLPSIDLDEELVKAKWTELIQKSKLYLNPINSGCDLILD